MRRSPWRSSSNGRRAKPEPSGQQTITAQLQALGRNELPLPIGVLVLLQLLALPMAAFINLVPALGEELGWRGWLLPKLMPLGAIPAILTSGVIWGLWHTPLILLGYNYPGFSAGSVSAR